MRTSTGNSRPVQYPRTVACVARLYWILNIMVLSIFSRCMAHTAKLHHRDVRYTDWTSQCSSDPQNWNLEKAVREIYFPKNTIDMRYTVLVLIMWYHKLPCIVNLHAGLRYRAPHTEFMDCDTHTIIVLTSWELRTEEFIKFFQKTICNYKANKVVRSDMYFLTRVLVDNVNCSLLA